MMTRKILLALIACLCAQQAGAAVTLVRSNSADFGGLTNAPTLTSVQVDAAGDYIVACWSYRAGGGGSGSDVHLSAAPTWNGQTFTSLVAQFAGSAGDNRMVCYYLKAATATTASIVAVGADSGGAPAYGNYVGGWGVFTGMHASAPVGTPATESDPGTWAAPSRTVTDGVANDLVVEFIGSIGWDSGYSNVSAATWNPASSQTEAFEQNVGAGGAGTPRLTMATKAGSTSVAMSYSSSSGQPVYTHAVVVLKQSAGGGATNNASMSTLGIGN